MEDAPSEGTQKILVYGADHIQLQELMDGHANGSFYMSSGKLDAMEAFITFDFNQIVIYVGNNSAEACYLTRHFRLLDGIIDINIIVNDSHKHDTSLLDVLNKLNVSKILNNTKTPHLKVVI